MISCYADVLNEEWARDCAYTSWIHNTSGSLDYGNTIRGSINDLANANCCFSEELGEVLEIAMLNKKLETISLKEINPEILESIHKNGINIDKYSNFALKTLYEKHLIYTSNSKMIGEINKIVDNLKSLITNSEWKYKRLAEHDCCDYEEIANEYCYLLLDLMKLSELLEIPSIVKDDYDSGNWRQLVSRGSNALTFMLATKRRAKQLSKYDKFKKKLLIYLKL